LAKAGKAAKVNAVIRGQGIIGEYFFKLQELFISYLGLGKDFLVYCA